MRTLLHFLRVTIVIVGLVPAMVIAQAPPSDFHFSATSGGNAPWSEMVRITIDSAGGANFVRSKSGGAPTILAHSTFTIGSAGLQQLWHTIQDSGFFSLNAVYSDTTVRDGMFARISVNANGVTHQVKVFNVAPSEIQAIIRGLNAIVPDSVQLPFSAPNSFNYAPQDPCAPTSGSVVDPRSKAYIQHSRDLKIRAFPGPYPRVMNRLAQVDLSHPGTVVAYNETLPDAIGDGRASFGSKGDYYGDAVSITIDDRTLTPRPNTISITLFLEFWGPLATQANIDAICEDIASKWDGVTTSGGQKVQMGFVTEANTSATSPPNTPGYHEIDLVPLNATRSNVDGSPVGNGGTGSCTWEVGADPGTYGHEAGHLMGLPDEYTDYNKQADGSWVNSKTGQSYPDDNSFVDYIQTKFPDNDLNSIKDFLKDNDVYSIPKDGFENDLMANVSKKPTQAEIDQVTAHPGLLVNIPVGTPLVNRATGEQDLVTTRNDYVFVGPGEERTLNGVYAACIDHNLSIPSIGGVFDVAPPLSQWTGIRAAQDLALFLHYVDSARLYCELDFNTQAAIWRISDNAASYDPEGMVDSLLQAAGVPLSDQILDFPRLDRRSSTDTTSHLFVPNQLYVANILPAFSDGQIGKGDSLGVQVSHPLSTPPAVGVAWNALGPAGASVPITGSGASASLTPTTSGIYRVSVGIVFNDSLHGQETVPSERNAYVIVPDTYTETFEHAGLTDKYPWMSLGTAPWTISNKEAETGHSSAQPAPVADNQQSTLAIDVLLPQGDSIFFSMRSLMQTFPDNMVFAIDSLPEDFFSETSDWRPVAEYIEAGRHRLTWTYTNSSPTPASNIWLDNIFFPGNVVVTSIDQARPTLPTVFALDQNYPNPFNPTTTIRYALPRQSHVVLSLFNTLGQKVEDLVISDVAAGYHDVKLNGSSLASGAYFYRLEARSLDGGQPGNFVQTRKLLLVK